MCYCVHVYRSLSTDLLSLTEVSGVQVLPPCEHVESSLLISVSKVFVSTMCCLQTLFALCNNVFANVVSSTSFEVCVCVVNTSNLLFKGTTSVTWSILLCKGHFTYARPFNFVLELCESNKVLLQSTFAVGTHVNDHSDSLRAYFFSDYLGI